MFEIDCSEMACGLVGLAVVIGALILILVRFVKPLPRGKR